MSKNCLNCGQTLSGSYCSNCGQRDIEPGIRIKEVVEDYFSYNFSFEGPIWRTLKLLVVHPGTLFASFIAGKRKSFYKPIQFFIVATVIYFALAEIVSYDPLAGQFGDPQKEQLRPIMVKIQAATNFMVKNINNFLFLLVFTNAIVLKLAHWRKQTFAEYLAISFYIAGAYILFSLVDLVAWLLELNLGATRIVFFLFYFGYAYASFMPNKKALRFFAGLFLAVFSFLLYFVGAFGFSWLLVNGLS